MPSDTGCHLGQRIEPRERMAYCIGSDEEKYREISNQHEMELKIRGFKKTVLFAVSAEANTLR